MSETLEPVVLDEDEKQQIAQRLVDQAKAEGVDLMGPGGLLSGLTKQVLETALEEEMADHLGYDKHDPVGRNGQNSRNGTRSKTVLTDIGPVELDVPRDRQGTFEPRIVKKRQGRLDGVDQIVLSLTARGLTTGEVAAHFADVYDAQVSKDTISRITDKVIGEMAEWQTRPLDRVYPVIFIDAIHVKIRDGKVANRPIYVALAVTCEGRREILGLWAGNFEQLQLVPLLVVTPLVFLGGSFYSISMLPPVWQTITLFNPVVYLISGFRWAFFDMADVSVGVSLMAIAGFTAICLGAIWWIFRTGWRIRS